jgi:hypothetical protein
MATPPFEMFGMFYRRCYAQLYPLRVTIARVKSMWHSSVKRPGLWGIKGVLQNAENVL